MSLFFFENNELISFTDYIVSESVRPKEISYGSNEKTDNLKIEEQPFGLTTWFKSDDKFYMVILSKKGDFGFGVKEETFSSNIKEYDHSRKQTRNVVSVFGYVIYVLSKLAEKSKSKFIKFSAADPALGKVYERMIKNKYLMEDIQTLGFKYFGFIDDNYMFIKK